MFKKMLLGSAAVIALAILVAAGLSRPSVGATGAVKSASSTCAESCCGLDSCCGPDAACCVEGLACCVATPSCCANAASKCPMQNVTTSAHRGAFKFTAAAIGCDGDDCTCKPCSSQCGCGECSCN